MQKRMKARGLSLLLLLAMLVVSVAVILPTVASADPAEIQDFGVQTLSALDLAGDADTDLRFVFTVGSLAYDEVGFVFSKSNDTPTVGGDACVKKATTVVYTTITADGTPRQASDGRFWVAVKLTDVPHAYFDGALYVRPYVDDGAVRYGDAALLTVCSAAGHKHAPQLLQGHCDGCNLDGVKSGEPYILNSNLPTSGQYCAYGSRFIDSRPYKNICGTEKYYPDESNGYAGNDLLIEFSILWNGSLNSGAGSTFDIGVWDGSDIANIDLKGGSAGNFSAKERTGTTYIYPTNPEERHPSIGEYGWHRIGIRVHEEAAKVDASVQYTFIITVYLDGEMILRFDSSPWATANTKALLYTAAIEDDHLVYTPNTSNSSKGSISIEDYFTVSDTYLGIADVFMTCGDDFVQQVVPVADPAAATIEVEESVELSAKMWYTALHAHVPAAEYTVDLAPTCTTPGSKSYHCTICGAIIDETITPVEPTGDAHVPAAEYTVDTPATCTTLGSRSKHCTLCGAIIPETVESIAMVAHTPAAEYTIDVAPTCVATGSESKHCTVCNASVVETARVVAIDPDAHNVASWTTTVQPTLLADGTKSGECTLCHDTIYGTVPYAGPTILQSSDKTKGTWDVRPTFQSLRGEDHFYPAASNGYEGNDLLIEFSILWNDTMETVYGAGSTFDIGVNDGSDIANIDLQSATSGNFSAKEREGTTYIYPTPAAIAEDASVKHPSIGADGWHRVGVRVHQEAAKVDASVQYTYIITIYLDGEMILKYDSSAWATVTPGALLFTATIENDQLVYHDNDISAAKANTTIVNYYKGSNNYLVLADQSMTCGHNFVQNVEAVAAPPAASIELGGNNYPAAIYYRFAD